MARALYCWAPCTSLIKGSHHVIKLKNTLSISPISSPTPHPPKIRSLIFLWGIHSSAMDFRWVHLTPLFPVRVSDWPKSTILPKRLAQRRAPDQISANNIQETFWRKKGCFQEWATFAFSAPIKWMWGNGIWHCYWSAAAIRDRGGAEDGCRAQRWRKFCGWQNRRQLFWYWWHHVSLNEASPEIYYSLSTMSF